MLTATTPHTLVTTQLFVSLVLLQGLHAQTLNHSGLPLVPLQELEQIATFTNGNPIQGQQQSEHKAEKTIIIIFENYNNDSVLKELDDVNETAVMDTFALTWYISSFSALVFFFLLVSITECLSTRHIASATPELLPLPGHRCDRALHPRQCVQEMPPPPYHLFGPPEYDSLFYGKGLKGERKECEVFTIAVHQTHRRHS